MTTDYKTEVQSARDIIREFLALPAEAMPSAIHTNEETAMVANAWSAIRDYMLPEDARQYPHCGDEIRLHADRAGWRNVTVTLI